MQENSRHGIVYYILNTIFLFLYIYQFRLETFGLPAAFHSTRIGAVCLFLMGVFYYWKRSSTENQIIKNLMSEYFYPYVKLCLCLMVVAFLQLMIIGRSDGISSIDVMMNILIFTIPVVWALLHIYDNVQDFMKVLVLVGIIQSGFIVYCLANDSFATTLDIMFNNVESETHNTTQLRYGYAGGLGCITAGGMIRYSVSLMAAVFLYLTKRTTRYLLLFSFFAILCSMIARTGLLFDVLCVLCIIRAIGGGRNIIKFVLPATVVFFVLYALVESGNYDSFLSDRFHRYVDLREDGLNEGYFDGFKEGSIPPININTLFGVGCFSGTSHNGYEVRIDGGYLRVYSGFGIILCLFIYYCIYRWMIKIIKDSRDIVNRCFATLVCLLFVLAEFKEITYFIVWPMAFYFTTAVLLRRNELLNNKLVW